MLLKAAFAAVALACLYGRRVTAQSVDDATAAPPTIRFEYAFYAVPADFPYLWVSAYRVGNLQGPATAAWTTADSSAVSGVDYKMSTGELTWADGVGGAQQLYVPLIPRRDGPYDRTFTVLLHDQTGAALGFPSAAVVTISQPSVWQLWADGSTGTGAAAVDPFAVPDGATGSEVTTSPSDGAAAANAAVSPNVNANSAAAPPTTVATSAGGSAVDPSANAIGNANANASGGSNSAGAVDSGSTTLSAPASNSAGTNAAADPTSTTTSTATPGGTAAPATPPAGDGANVNPQSNPQPLGSAPTTSGTPAGSAGQPTTGGSATTTTPAGGNQPVQPSGTSSSTTGGVQQQQQQQQQAGGGGGQASTGILTQFASAFTWDSAAYQTDNSNNFVVVGVSRLQVLPIGLQPCSVQYSTVDGTGLAGVDYTATSGVLQYDANDFSPRAIFIPIRMGDATTPPSGVKVFAIKLMNPTNAFLGVPSTAPISVSAVPFSEGKVVLTSDAYSTPMQAGVAVATVQRQIGSQGLVNVSYSTTDGTAKAGSEYTSTLGTLSWADGDVTPRNITIPLLSTSAAVKALPANGTVAGAPNFFLSLALGANSKGFLGGPRTAAMFITNAPPPMPSSSTGAGHTGAGTGTGTGPTTTQGNVGPGNGGTTTGNTKPPVSSTGTNKPPSSTSSANPAPPVVVPPPPTAPPVDGAGKTNTTAETNERSAAMTVGVTPVALLTVLLSAMWLSA